MNPRTAARQASLSFTISQSLLKLMSFDLVMLCNHLILCHPLRPPALNLSQQDPWCKSDCTQFATLCSLLILAVYPKEASQFFFQ